MARHKPRVQTQQAKPASHMVRAATRFHGHQTTLGQLSAPCKEALHRERLGQHQPARAIDRMDLENPLGQIHPYRATGARVISLMDFPFL